MNEPSRRGSKPVTGSAFYILLALADRDRHGLGIVEEIETRTAGAVTIGPGTLYHALHKLEASGLIRETERTPDPADDDPRRRYYTITRAGREVLRGEAARLDILLQVARDKRLLPG